MPCYTLKIRGGCSTYMKEDGKIGTAGKGPLIQIEKSATLGVNQDQYLFVPKSKKMIMMDSIGGNSERVIVTSKSPTIKATHYKFAPVVLSKEGNLHE